jgi:hypothetical protein
LESAISTLLTTSIEEFIQGLQMTKLSEKFNFRAFINALKNRTSSSSGLGTCTTGDNNINIITPQSMGSSDCSGNRTGVVAAVAATASVSHYQRRIIILHLVPPTTQC